MSANPRRWFLACVLGVWIAAGGAVRADDAAAPPAPPAGAAEAAKEKPPPARIDNPPAARSEPAVNPSGREKKAPRARKQFRPSEEIHVDKAVDFPADI